VKKKNISKIEVEYQHDFFYPSEFNKNLDKELLLDIPTDFLYNSGWKIKHECKICSGKAYFGMSYDPSLSRYPVYDFHRSKNICEKYYSKEMIQSLAILFDDVELLTASGQFYLAKRNNFNKEFPVSSSITVSNHKCTKCEADYLVNLTIKSPRSPDQGIPMGVLGMVKVYEVLFLPMDISEIKDKLF